MTDQDDERAPNVFGGRVEVEIVTDRGAHRLLPKSQRNSTCRRNLRTSCQYPLRRRILSLSYGL